MRVIRRCLVLPVLFFRVAQVGDSAIRAAENRCGPQASRSLAQLHSGMMSQFLKLFVPYVEGLTKTVKSRGVSLHRAALCLVAWIVCSMLLGVVVRKCRLPSGHVFITGV